MGLFDFLGTGEEQPLQLSGPVDPNAIQVDYGSPSLGQARPSVGGGDFAKGLAHAYSAGASFGQGDPNYLMRFEHQMQGKRALDQRDRALSMQALDNFPKAIQMIEFFRDFVPDEKKAAAAPKIRQAMADAGVDFLDEDTIIELGKGGGSGVEQLQSTYDFVRELPKSIQHEIVKTLRTDPAKGQQKLAQYGMQISAKAIQEGKPIPASVRGVLNKDQRTNLSEQGGDFIRRHLEKVGNEIVVVNGKAMSPKEMTPDEIEQNLGVANLDLLPSSDLDRLQAAGWTKFVSPEVQRAALTSDITEGRQERARAEQERIGDERQQKSIAASDKRQLRALGTVTASTQAQINAQNERFEESEARRIKEEGRRERQARRINPTQERELSTLRTSVDMIDSYQQAHDNLMKETKGDLSATLKGALAKNAKATTLAQITQIAGKTDAEKKFAAQFNNIWANIRQMANEPGVMTEQDAVRLLQSFDPATTPGQFKENVTARRTVQTRLLQRRVDTLRDMGKDIPATLDAPKEQAAPARPRATNPQTGEIVEWDGKAWVKVK